MECFCYKLYKENGKNMTSVLGYEITKKFKKTHYPCKEWAKEFENVDSVENSKRIKIYGSALTLSIMNAALRIILQFMSELERKHTETERLTSAVSKMWIV